MESTVRVTYNALNMIFRCVHAFDCGALASIMRLIVLSLAVVSFGAKSDVINIYTEHFPPYNFQDDGEMAGVSLEVIREVMDSTGFDYQIMFNPWIRAMTEARRDPNGLIFSIARRSSREDQFLWVSKLVPATQSVFALSKRDDIVLETISDISNYSVTTEIDDSREVMLKEHGIDINQFIRLSGPDARFIQYELLKKGRVELWPIPDAVAYYVVKELGEPSSSIAKKLELDGDGDYYLAANLNFPEDKLTVIKALLDAYKQTERYRELLAEWGLSQH